MMELDETVDKIFNELYFYFYKMDRSDKKDEKMRHKIKEYICDFISCYQCKG